MSPFSSWNNLLLSCVITDIGSCRQELLPVVESLQSKKESRTCKQFQIYRNVVKN